MGLLNIRVGDFILKKTLLFLLLLFYVALYGCASSTSWQNQVDTTQPKIYKHFNKSDNVVNDSDVAETNESYMNSLGESQGYFITIDDFDLEKDCNKPLPMIQLNDSKFNELISEIDDYYTINSDSFRLYHLINYDEWVTFRMIESNDSDKMYYCIAQNTDNQSRCYLIFTQYYTTLACLEYMVVDSNGSIANPLDNSITAASSIPKQYILDCDLIVSK